MTEDEHKGCARCGLHDPMCPCLPADAAARRWREDPEFCKCPHMALHLLV